MVEKMNADFSLVDVVDRILGMGIVIEKFLAFLEGRIYSLCSGIFQIFQNIGPHNRYIMHIPFHLTKGVCT